MALRDRLRGFVFDHARANALPTLLVTHDPDDAAATGGRVLEIGAQGEGENMEPCSGGEQARGTPAPKGKPVPAAG